MAPRKTSCFLAVAAVSLTRLRQLDFALSRRCIETYVQAGAEGSEGVYLQRTSRLAEIVAEVPQLSQWPQWYRAPWWLRQGDLMTIASTLREVVDLEEPEKHILPTSDGGDLTLDFYPRALAPTVILLPGLGGNSRGGYVKNMAHALRRRGFQAVAMNMRGVGQNLRGPRVFSAHRGSTDDVRRVVTYLRSERGLRRQKIFLLGWSLGGNILVNALAEQKTLEGLAHEGELSFIDGGVALCATHCLVRCSQQWMQHWPMRHIYDPHVMRNLKRILEPALPFYERPVEAWNGSMIQIEKAEVEKSSRIRELDEALIRRIFGYESVDDYYFQASCSRRLAHVPVPLLMVSAADDPMASGWAPFKAFRDNEHVVLAYTKHGGHIAWQDESNSRTSHWVEAVASSFLERVRQC